MKFEIMLSILLELLVKRTVQAKYLAEKYEVSVRSIYRYMSSLEEAGVPIYTVRGNNGGFSVVDTFRLSSNYFTEKEFDKIISVLTAFVDGVPDKTINSIILKLKATAKKDVSGFDLKAGNLIIDAGPWGDTVGYKAKLTVIEKSIDECRQLAITYHDRNGKVSERIIEPHVIVFKQGLWYAYAYCKLRNEFRFFKTGRIEKATLLNTKFERKDLSKMDLPLDFWHNSVETEEIKFEIKESVLSDVEEWLGIENVENINGKYISTVSLPYDNGLVMKIMSFGNGLKIISPKKLKDKIVSAAEELRNAYEV